MKTSNSFEHAWVPLLVIAASCRIKRIGTNIVQYWLWVHLSEVELQVFLRSVWNLDVVNWNDITIAKRFLALGLIMYVWPRFVKASSLDTGVSSLIRHSSSDGVHGDSRYAMDRGKYCVSRQGRHGRFAVFRTLNVYPRLGDQGSGELSPVIEHWLVSDYLQIGSTGLS